MSRLIDMVHFAFEAGFFLSPPADLGLEAGFFFASAVSSFFDEAGFLEVVSSFLEEEAGFLEVDDEAGFCFFAGGCSFSSSSS